MDENNKFDVVGTNIAEKATMIWNVADMLRGPFKPHEYGLVILPMTVVKRFHDCLLPTHKAVLEKYEEVKKFAVIDGFLTTASQYQFYNISKYTFDSLLADPENIEANFRDYLNGFSANVQDVLSKFDFDNIIRRMVESNTLYLVIKEFNSQKGYLGPDKISAVDCGYIFEDLVKRFSESFGEEAGAHFTSRDIIYLMTDLLLSDADLSKGGNVTVYDMAMGTSQMLSCMEERIQELNTEIGVTCFGQEFNPSTFAIAKADMMIRGGDPNNMRFGDTLSEDQFSGYQFQYIISNPPFGIDWKREKAAVEAEAKKGDLGRFAPGLPKISDGQQLFVLNGLSKLAPNGKMAIIQNGSPLFSGDAGSGPSEIRRYILENDWLDAIVQLGTDMFMNTGISTYIWICSKDKPLHRTGKVQLIDASHCYEARRKSIGTKRNDITDQCRDLIVKAYGAFENDAVYGDKEGIYCQSKIFDTEEFGYQKIVVEQPQRDENEEIVIKKGKPVADISLRDTENVPLTEDIKEYFKREVLPYAPEAWIDEKKTKKGYEIPMTRYFYEYQAPEPVEEIAVVCMNWNWKFRAVWILCLGVNDMSREMKDSGVEWIGEIPKNWNVQRVKNAFVRKKAEAHQENPVVLSLARAGVKVRDLSKNEGQIAESYYNYNLVEFGDLLLNPMDLYSGANCSISMVEGVISPAYINLRAKSGYSSRFYDYYFKTQYWSMAMFAHGKGVSFENRWTLGIEELFNYKIPVPLENEQDKIADFLDEQCEKINLAIEKAKVSIEEYRNLKQSFITQIVTKGINENDTMKESGIEWIGKIPASWKVTQLRHCASIRSGITLGKTYSKDTELVEMPYLRVANVQDGYVDTNDIAVLQVSKDEIEKYSLSAGEVLMTEGGDRDKLGRGCVWDGRITPCLHQNHIFAVKVKEKLLNPHYLEYLTASSVGRTYFDVTAVKTTNLACTSSSKVLAFTIPLPSIDEQNEIVDYLKEKCGCIENVIFKKEQFISELENYKKSLIYEYVTGKKEVPEI